MSKKGREYEHHLSTLVADATDLVPLGGGFNGATAWDVDMLIDDGEAVHVFELKRTEQDAYSVMWDKDDRQRDDLYGLHKFCVNYPRPAYPYVGVRFNRNQIFITRSFIENWPDQDELLETAVMLAPCENAVSVTHSNNLRFRKDDLPSDWNRTNIDQHDTQAVLDAIGYVF